MHGRTMSAILLTTAALAGCAPSEDDPAQSAANIREALGETAGASVTEEPEPTLSAAPMGQPARDGSLEFIVRSIECGLAEVRGDYTRETPTGQYCRLDLTVRNIGDAPAWFWADEQKLLDGEARRHGYDTMATITAGQEGSQQLNPGTAIDVSLWYDVPASVTPHLVELHDSAFSGGAYAATAA